MITFTAMKQILFLAFITTIFISCKDNVDDKNEMQVSSKNLVLEKPVIKPVEISNTTGSFIERFANGNLKTEGWRNSESQRDGIWYAYYEHGPKWSELTYVNGVREGESIVYFPDASINYKGSYKNDKKTGTWVFYKEDGSVESEKKY